MEGVYTDHEVRIHLTRFRDILSAFKPTTQKYGSNAAQTFLSAVLPEQQDEAQKAVREKVIIELFANYDFKGADSNAMDLLSIDNSPVPKKCIEGISPSKFNPPSLSKKTAGDLFYLNVTTLEGESLEITCSCSGFYLNDSNFSPSIEKDSDIHSTLISLLSATSPLFKKNFEELSKQNASVAPFDYLQTNTPCYPWAIKSELLTADIGRTLDLNLSASDMLASLSTRDWNEDIQSAAELPRESGADRIMRDQARSKAHYDFIDAAMQGAMSVIDRSIVPINPQDSIEAQMFIHNNIFFSQGYDNQEQFENYGGRDAAHVAVSKDINGINTLMNLDLPDVHTVGTCIVDYKGQRIVCQTIVPGILKKSDNQESAIQYGSIDGGIEILSNHLFGPTAQTVGKALRLAEHKIKDGKDATHTLFTSVDTKGVQGTDSRRYLMDLYRNTPVDIEFLDAAEKEQDTNPYPHQMALLRPELIELFYQSKIQEAVIAFQEKEKAAKQANADAVVEKPDFNFTKVFNPDVFTLAKLDSSPAELEAEQQFVRELSSFTWRIISQMVFDIVRFNVSMPHDSEGLTKLLHIRGISMRQLGKITLLFDQMKEFSLPLFKDICVQEMVSRAAKILLRQYLKETPSFLVKECIAHFFNCLFMDTNAKPKAVIDSIHHHVQLYLSQGEQFLWSSLTPASLQKSIIETVKSRFRYDISQTDRKNRNLPVLRTVCMKVGIQIEAKTYEFVATPIFCPQDIHNMYPIVKHAAPRAAFSEDAFEHGRMCLVKDDKQLGNDLIKEALSMQEQIYGPIHPETAKSYANVAMIQFNNEEKNYPQLVAIQRRAVTAFERTRGVDDPDTLQQYTNLAYFEFLAGNQVNGLELMAHALKISALIHQGYMHPDIAASYANTGAMLQSLNQYELAVKFHETAAAINVQMMGAEHPSTISSQEILVQSYFLNSEFKKALMLERQVYNQYKIRFGEDDARTIEQAQVLTTLATKAVEAVNI